MSADIRVVADAALARRALAEVIGGAASVEHLGRVLARDDIRLLVAYVDDVPVGFTYGYELPRLKQDEVTLLLYEIEVVPARRRQGIGRALLEGLMDVACSRGCRRAWLLTNASNGPAMALYRAAGGRRPHRDDALIRFDLRSRTERP